MSHIALLQPRRFALALLICVGVALTGCSYTQLAESPATYDDYDPEPDYVPEPARGAFGQLSTWGYWVEVPEFGWVWQPDVVSDWQPYYYGHWAWTQFEWTWVSYEPFGWITYHYGYWHYDPHYGWLWVPDYYWFPNGVTWIHYDDYIYWAPIPPPGYHLVDPWLTHHDFIWMTVHADHFLHRDIGNFRYRRHHSDPRYGSKKVLRKAPGKVYIERRTRTSIRPLDVEIKKFKSGDREYKRITLPRRETKSVDTYRPRDRKNRDLKNRNRKDGATGVRNTKREKSGDPGTKPVKKVEPTKKSKSEGKADRKTRPKKAKSKKKKKGD
jgi:hypothetical protein